MDSHDRVVETSRRTIELTEEHVRDGLYRDHIPICLNVASEMEQLIEMYPDIAEPLLEFRQRMLVLACGS